MQAPEVPITQRLTPPQTAYGRFFYVW